MNRTLLRSAAIFLAAFSLQAFASPVVTLDSGRISGRTADGVDVFKGIPYAAPPVGKLRWEPPAPVAHWQGVRDATRFGPICPQPVSRRIAGSGHKQSEDCLYLNVWAPANARKAPVMVWIHGGAFRFGSGELPFYNGRPFAKDGVVLVTINYRLGLLGYFAHPALTRAAGPDAPLGNYGSMDQIAALRWVKRNIARFGGDPSNVTVFGESAGGSSVLYLFATPSARGLFAKAIVESGGGWNKPKPLAQMERRGAAFATSVGLPGANATLAQLRALPVKETFKVPFSLGGVGPFEDGRLIRETPARAFASGDAFDVPLIIGSNSYEASLMKAFRMPPDKVLGWMTPTLRALYGKDNKSDEKIAEAFFTDAIMGAPAHWIARQEASGAPAWLYHFSYVTSFMRGKVPGASHGSEISYVFDTTHALTALFPMISLSKEDIAMAHLMHSCWVGFAKTGKPACDGVKWPAYTKKTDALLDFGTHTRVRTHFRSRQYKALARAIAGAN